MDGKGMRKVIKRKPPYKSGKTKTKARGNPRRLFIAISVMLCIGLTCLGFYLLSGWLKEGDIFRLRMVEVKGNSELSRIDVIRITNATVGTSLLGFDTQKAQAALEANNWVEEAKITRQFPDKLIISIKERRPVAILNLGKLYLVDQKGVIFDELGKRKLSLPIISGIEKEDLEQGSLPKYAKSALELLVLASNGPKLLSVNNISELRLDGRSEILVYTRDRAVPVRIASKHMKRDLERAEKVLYHLYNSKSYSRVAEIDMEYGPDQAWVKLKGVR